MSEAMSRNGHMADESWQMVEEAVFRLFEELAGKNAGDHVAIGGRLAELGWSEIEAEYPVAACELLFRAQGRSLALTDLLDRVMLAELSGVLDGPADHVLLPDLAAVCVPGSDAGRVSGIVLGPLEGRIVVPVSGPAGTVSVGVVDSSRLEGQRLDTFDASTYWTRASGSPDAPLVEASAPWNQALAAARRALATELVELAERALRIAVEHVSVRVQFGAPIGSFQSPRHALADASAVVAGARALLDESWRSGGELSALGAKAAAGRAHRAVSDVALQVCGAIGLTSEHDLHRYVTRGFQIDALCGSHDQLEGLLAGRLFDDSDEDHAPGRALPAVVTWAE
ncbi:acyl-CoA dehydrogenase family protein [Mycobacterium paraintracellulare]|uniref:acyl-CoA dehydrogenase family protein n=1 Tax=Mycobacterium paraintracellulare TaxID=1138383 RepID=UPI0019355CD5|nr:acyl-CoA dehydrogenase family protein [Mycobacterium paraintracellulare]BCP05478.1 acyl-CoA dehydrogenase [Mycobacterium paraintracellulare]